MYAESSSKEDMRRGYAQAVLELMDEDERYVALVADSRLSSHLGFVAQRYPKRVIDVGVAEQNLIGVAVGLAELGLVPLVSGICNFAVMRPFEQIRTLIGHRRLNVKIAGMASGLSYPFLGASHNAVEDIALMRSIPNFVVMYPADANQAKAITIAAARHDGPVYVRFGATQERDLFPPDATYRMGEVVAFGSGCTVALLTAGPLLATCLEVSEQLDRLRCESTVMNLPTIKPLPEQMLARLARSFQLICTIEEHSVIGGLGSAVCEYFAAWSTHPRIFRIGVPDRFPMAGSRAEVLEAFGLSASAIASACLRELEAARCHRDRKDSLACAQE
jgi:transketolase